MTIDAIKSLIKSDVGVYKNTLLANQMNIISKLKDEKIFISVSDIKTLEAKINAIADLSEYDYPLLGIPFAVKDNIDVKGFETTAGCKAYGFTPTESAYAV